MSAAERPLYFGRCFGWLHGGSGSRAALLCPALGAEYLVLHRFTRRLAIELAEAGIPTLRFDYPGTGDSPDVPDESRVVEEWLAAVALGVQTARRLTGATDIVLVGFQVGALLAACSGRNLPDVRGIAMIAPVASGRAYNRELKLRASVQRSGAASADDAAASSATADLEINGFAFADHLRSGVQRLDIAAPGSNANLEYLLLGLPDWEADNRLAATLRSRGHEVVQSDLRGLAGFQWHSTFATLPNDTFDQLIEWCRRLTPAPTPVPNTPGSECAALYDHQTYSEIPTRFGSDDSLFGVYCRPSNPGRNNLCVVIGNHGANHHVGWGNMYVPMARTLAAIGIASFRFDFSGIGDSSTAPGEAERELYSNRSLVDIRQAVDHVILNCGHEVMLLGHCSGAYQAFYAAVADDRVKAIAMVNLATFHWKPGDSLEEAERHSARTISWYVRNLFRLDTVGRLVRGRIDVLHVLRAFARWFSARATRVRFLFSRESTSQPPVLQHFRALSERGTKILLIYSDNDSGLDELALRGGRRIEGLRNVSVRLLTGADHNVSAHACRAAYFAILCEFIARTSADLATVGGRNENSSADPRAL